MNGTLMLYIDQVGRPYWARTVKELCKTLDYSRAEKMYCDFKDGTSAHIGYIVGPNWLTAYIPYKGAMS